MAYSGIGGQAVMEGVMMQNGDKYAVAVRKPDHDIEVSVKNYTSIAGSGWHKKIPLVRGVISFIDSLVLGIGTLTYSASFFEDEEDEKEEKPVKNKEAKEKAIMGGTVAFSLVLAVAIFIILPYFLSNLFEKFVSNMTAVAIFEGVLRLAIFIGYILLISRMEEIQRVFRYHGAEHKCINCIEHGLPLTVDNVKKSSRIHKRCGTSFLVFVVIISIILFLFIRVDSHALRLVIRLILIPVIAGISYELIRFAGRSDNRVIEVLSKPGLAVQNITTKEPDESMIEVAIASVEAVFDWKEFLQKEFNLQVEDEEKISQES